MSLKNLIRNNGLILSLILSVSTPGMSAEVVTDNSIKDKYKEVHAKDDYRIVNVSESDINRIHCDAGITFYQTSSEKYLAVTFDPNDKKRVDMFIKIKPILISRDDDPIPKAFYEKSNKDLLVRCGETLYSLILHPMAIPSKTIYIYAKNTKTKSKMSESEGIRNNKGEEPRKISESFSYSNFKPVVEKGLDVNKAIEYEKKLDSYQASLISLISLVFKRNGDLPGYKTVKFDLQVDSYKQGGLILRKVFEGVSFRVYLYSFLAYETIEKPLREVDFAYLSEKPLAISLEDVVLNKGDMTMLAVVESSKTPFSSFVSNKLREISKKNENVSVDKKQGIKNYFGNSR